MLAREPQHHVLARYAPAAAASSADDTVLDLCWYAVTSDRRRPNEFDVVRETLCRRRSATQYLYARLVRPVLHYESEK